MDATDAGFTPACTLDALKARGLLLVRGRHRPVLLVWDRGQVFALDNRCPHMGFPLDKGTIGDGLITCHWHHARFDLASGCTFDLWADDVPTCPVEVRDGTVWIRPLFGPADPAAHWRQRLDDGLDHSLGLVMAKALRGLLAAGVEPSEILRATVRFGATNRDGWGSGLTILTALGNLLPMLEGEEIYLALWQGVRAVAADCEGEPPRRERRPLASVPDIDTLRRWLRRWSAARHREGAERTLLTAISAGTPGAVLAELLVTTETDRVFADGGHSLDFINKALESLDLIGWEHAAAVLPPVVGQMVAARGAEESTEWCHPIDLIALLEGAFAELPALLRANRRPGAWNGHEALAERLLGDDPTAVLGAVGSAFGEGATPLDTARSLCWAAALRVARFGTSNEHADWESAHHVFTYCNAVQQAIERIAGSGADPSAATRGLLSGAMALYLTRYLNVPPAPVPGEDGRSLDDLPDEPERLCQALLESFDRQQQGEVAARLLARYLLLEHEPQPLIRALARALLREDAGFHAYQMLEAAVRQFRFWGNRAPGRHALIAATRYLSAHSPTERAHFQTADIARRLLSGRAIHQDADEA